MDIHGGMSELRERNLSDFRKGVSYTGGSEGKGNLIYRNYNVPEW